jgi:hypothetical protein
MVAQPVAILAGPTGPMLEAQPYALTGRRIGFGDSTTDQDQMIDTINRLAPAAKALLQNDAYEDVEVLRAKIRNQTALMQWAPEPAKTIYRNNIAVLQAKLRAAQHAKQVELESESAQRTWRIFGWTFSGTGVLVGLAATAALLSMSKRGGR